ncbi:unnamed protein product [Ranitomeya imitator]|uniref:Uncharacterized protein n=1 Tax=Ranitomeya imitator TaxID=111125 RepID=A0ABN9L8C8_9NEOB|nr:unnamed protein product [Ranitomeya imitator]
MLLAMLRSEECIAVSRDDDVAVSRDRTSSSRETAMHGAVSRGVARSVSNRFDPGANGGVWHLLTFERLPVYFVNLFRRAEITWQGKRGRRSSAGSLDSNMEGSIISSPHMRRRATSTRECASRQSLPNSSSLLGSLFGSKRGKPSSQGHLVAGQAPPQHPTLISHQQHPTSHHLAQAEGQTQAQVHAQHSQYCHVPQNPPPYHHHHHYHPPQHIQPHQYHPHGQHSSHASYIQHPHAQHSHSGHSGHSAHSQHAPHHHSQPVPSTSTSTKPKHSGISTIV